MNEVKLILKTNGYAPVSVNPGAFDVPPEEVQISREENVWSVVVKFATSPTSLCGNIVNCDVPYEVTELRLPESIKTITTPLGWLVIKTPESLSINKSLLSADGSLIIYKDKVLRQIGKQTSVVIPDGITTIGESAFEGKEELEKVEFPASVTVIEDCAFKKCWSLSIKFPKNLQTIGDYAFERCGRTKTSKINIPAKVTKIGNYAFKSCSEVTGVKIGKSVVEIGQGAFAACDRIRTFEGVGAECDGKFLIMDKRLIAVALDTSILDISELIIPDNIEEIGDWAITYEDNNRHWRVVKKLPSGLKRIGVRALYGSGGSAPVAIPDSVEEIGEGAFSPKMRVTGKYVTEDGVVIKDGVLLFKNYTREISVEFGYEIEATPEYTVPDGVTRIGDYANLVVGKLTLPEGLESIGEDAVSGLNEIRMPSTLKHCSGLRCKTGCEPLAFPAGLVFIGTTFGDYFVTEIRLSSNPPVFTGNGYGGAVIVVPKEKFLLYKEAYDGIIDTSQTPNGRIAYRNAEGELCYELELSPEDKAKLEQEQNEFWQEFEALAPSNEDFFNILEKHPHGVMNGDGEKFYFIDIFPEYLRIELRYIKKDRKASCTLLELQDESSIHYPIYRARFKNETGLESEALFLSTGSDLKNRGIQWIMPAEMDNIGIYGILYTAGAIQADVVAPKIKAYLEKKEYEERVYLEKKAYEERVTSGKSMYRRFYKQGDMTEVEIPDTKGVTDFREMFDGCWHLKSIPQFDTSSGIGFDGTFHGCVSIKELPDFDFSNAESLDLICSYCRYLESIEWRSTSSVKSFKSAFSSCDNLKHLVLDLSSALNTEYMCGDSKKLSDITLINLGANPDCVKLDLESLSKWAKKNVIESLVKLSFDRTAAGYSPVELEVAPKVFTVLKPEDIAKIEAKGYKLTK